jgi:hypothetical protein
VQAHQPDLPAASVPQDYFSSKLAQLKRTFPEPVVAIHVEPKNRLCRTGRFRPRLSTGVMIVDTPRELVLVTGGEPTRSLLAPNYATDVLVVPYRCLDSYEVLEPPGEHGQDFRTLVLRAGSQSIEQPCLDHPEAAIAALNARGVQLAQRRDPAVGLR